MSVVYMAPEKSPVVNPISLFLAGSIDMGSAVDWQTQVTNALKDYSVDIYNPRRSDWDSTWEQDIKNDKFREQVQWELYHQTMASLICFYFDPKGQAPITLLELGLFHDKNIVVCCPDGYFRKGNVDVVCNYYGIPQVNTLQHMIDWLQTRIELNDKFV